MAIFNGRAFAADWQNRLQKKLDGQPVALAVVLVGEDSASQAFVKIKQKFGEEIGVEVSVREYDENITTEYLITEIEKIQNDKNLAGLIAQLPLPKQIDTAKRVYAEAREVMASLHTRKDAASGVVGQSCAPNSQYKQGQNIE